MFRIRILEAQKHRIRMKTAYWSGWVTPRQESWLRRDPSPAAAGSPGSSLHAGTWTPGSKFLTIQANIFTISKTISFPSHDSDSLIRNVHITASFIIRYGVKFFKNQTVLYRIMT
jgi:hypothetical protein